MDIEKIASEIVDAAIKVHKALGPGLLESAYQQCLIYELKKRGLKVDSEVAMPVTYDGMRIDADYRMDIVVDGLIVIENKTVGKNYANTPGPVVDLSETKRDEFRFFI